MSNLATLNREIEARYARHAMNVLYDGIQNFEQDARLVDAGREELVEFAERLARLLQRNAEAA